ncbi:TerC family protein [Arsenicitalea aurantiaca]|uniref:TerC family protein n=1 Tax=Arsenicitalea aurantiaca TaxID=1783274 RepID=A0A433XFY1_9HYPH|nr:TerC family protein [Arsenicitalea aurantiaca]
MLELLTDPTIWIAFGTLTVMEIVLGIDNIVFISVLVSRLPAAEADRARKIGIGLALVFRILLLFAITWIIGLTQPVISAFGFDLSWKDIILLTGGLFLIYKATHEMHAEIEEPHEADLEKKAVSATFSAIIGQIVIIDMVFSIDSIVTAVGMVPADQVVVMIAAVLVAVTVMFLASGPIAHFVAENPTTKVLALAFLLLIGVSLVADGLGFHIPKGYIYSAMAFSVLVEAFHIFARRRKARHTANPTRLAAAATLPGQGALAAAIPSGPGPVLAEPAEPRIRPRSTPASRARARPKSAPRKK